MNAFVFANREILQERIEASELAKDHPSDDIMRCMSEFADDVAGRQLVPQGAALKYMLLAHKLASMPNNMPLAFGLLLLVFEDVLTVFVPDNPEFVQEAVEHMDASRRGA